MYPYPYGIDCPTSQTVGAGLGALVEAAAGLAVGTLYGGAFAARRIAETLMWEPGPLSSAWGPHGCGPMVHHHYHDCCVPPCHGCHCHCGCGCC